MIVILMHQTFKTFVFFVFQSDVNDDEKLGCGEIMEPCDVNVDCCELLICDNGRCFTAKG